MHAVDLIRNARVPERAKKALHTLSGVARCLREDPKLTYHALANLPDVIRGIRFGRDTRFQSDGPPPDKNPAPDNPLATYFNAYQQGPGIFKWEHYFDAYHRHFQRFVGREVHILEVGIYSGGSLRMWRNYFGERARIYGVDISEACRAYEDERTRVFIGDQADRAFWAQVRKEVPVLDIVIDDGGHLSEQQRITLEETLPHLRAGGVYFCEDVHHNFNAFAAYAHGLCDAFNWSGHNAPESTLQSAIHSVHLYPFCVVIEKRDVPVDRLVNTKRGTQWQPPEFWKAQTEAKALLVQR